MKTSIYLPLPSHQECHLCRGLTAGLLFWNSYVLQ
jgi:hypothetical protein